MMVISINFENCVPHFLEFLQKETYILSFLNVGSVSYREHIIPFCSYILVLLRNFPTLNFQ
jgi:hypothetical protein